MSPRKKDQDAYDYVVAHQEPERDRYLHNMAPALGLSELNLLRLVHESSRLTTRNLGAYRWSRVDVA